MKRSLCCCPQCHTASFISAITQTITIYKVMLAWECVFLILCRNIIYIVWSLILVVLLSSVSTNQINKCKKRGILMCWYGFTVFLIMTVSVSQVGSVRRTFPSSVDKCHSCERRVYMVERVCAEGLYFHRECFRCSTCSSALRQGAHAFDSERGLYCLGWSHISFKNIKHSH